MFCGNIKTVITFGIISLHMYTAMVWIFEIFEIPPFGSLFYIVNRIPGMWVLMSWRCM